MGCHDCWISVDEVEVVEKLLKKYKDLQQEKQAIKRKVKEDRRIYNIIRKYKHYSRT